MRDLQACVEILEQDGRLVRVKSEVDMKYELAGIAKKMEGREVLLFEKPKGFDFPVLIGLMWSRDNLGKIFGKSARDLPFYIGQAFAEWRAKAGSAEVEPVIAENAPAQEVRLDPVDVTALPTPILALEDGGHYLSNSVVIAKDPDTGVRNASIHRFMVTGPNRLTMLMDKGRHLRDYYERAESRGKPLEITINNGVSPAVVMAAISPSGAAPLDADELGIASVILGEPVRLSKSLTVAPEGIADAQYIIEGEILPYPREPEGPFGEVAGYYGEQDERWVVNIKAITRRENPIIHSLLPGMEVYNCVGLTGEASIYDTISKQMSGISNVYMPSGIYTAVVQMDPKAPGFAKQAIMATFAAFPPLQVVTVVNSDVDIFSQDEVQWALSTRFDPEKDLVIVRGSYGHELNPMVKNGLVNKIGFDCTCPVPVTERFRRVAFRDVNLNKYVLAKTPKP